MPGMKCDMKSEGPYCEECGDPVLDFVCPIDAQLCRNCYEAIDASCQAEE